jgi:hypothetical protein
MSAAETNRPKKVYRKPKLRVHGDMRQITETSGLRGKIDNTGKGHNRTG